MNRYGAALALLSLAVSSCAWLGSFRSLEVHDINGAPYYWGADVRPAPPVGFVGVSPGQRIYRQMQVDAALANEVELLTEAMNRYLATVDGLKSLGTVGLDYEEGPDIYVGSPDSYLFPGGETWRRRLADTRVQRDLSVKPVVRYQLEGAGAWRDAVTAQAAATSVGHVVKVSVGLSEYPIRAHTFAGSKEVVLGTNYRRPIGWFANLDAPIVVIHIIAILYDALGEQVRVGVEAFWTPGKQPLLNPWGFSGAVGASEFELARLARRDDLPGSPLSWQVALNTLLKALLGLP